MKDLSGAGENQAELDPGDQADRVGDRLEHAPDACHVPACDRVLDAAGRRHPGEHHDEHDEHGDHDDR